ncbi:MAG: aspartate aminotransferase family protein [Chloroflexota bacterium]|nr:MAG: hypothetical protein DLM70_05625 [Chloroflexota bacterium]
MDDQTTPDRFGGTAVQAEAGAETKQRLVDDAIKYVWRHGTPIQGTRQAQGPISVRGKGVRITDIDGKTYLDGLAGGSAAATMGYGREDIAAAVAEQMTKLHYTSIRTFLNIPAIELGKQIAETTGGKLQTSFFVSSGSEAVDTASQIAKAYHRMKGNTQKSKFLYRQMSFHGVSLVGASAASSPEYRDWFHPLAPGFIEVPGCYTYRRPEGKTESEWGLECAQAIEDEILRQRPETIAALFAEVMPAPIVLPPPPEYLRRIREICDQYDILWIDDEIFIGFGRTGKYFGYEHYGVVPDVVTVSKGLTGGYIPLGAAIASPKVMEVLVGDGEAHQAKVQGHTYTGHAVACAGALSVLKALRDERLVDNVARLGERLVAQFNQFAEEYPYVGDVRGKGFLIGIELVKDKNSKEPFPAEWSVGKKIVAAAQRNGFLCRSARDIVPQKGFEVGDIITFFPAFVATQSDIDEMVEKTKTAIVEVCDSLPL